MKAFWSLQVRSFEKQTVRGRFVYGKFIRGCCWEQHQWKRRDTSRNRQMDGLSCDAISTETCQSQGGLVAGVIFLRYLSYSYEDLCLRVYQPGGMIVG